MLTAVDSNVLLDIVTADASFGQLSRAALEHAHRAGGLLVSEVVWAEVTAAFEEPGLGAQELARLSVAFRATSLDAANRAGRAWRLYRRRGGPRSRLIADFLIGAHALDAADRLLTRDARFFRTYFPELDLLDPTA